MQLRPGQPGALLDTPDGIRLEGAPPGAEVAIEARLELGGQRWECSGRYVADHDGQVDTAVDSSSGGSYTGTDPFGLFWSADVPDPYDWDMPHPMLVALRATCDDLVVETSYQRPLLGPGVAELGVAEPGVAGRLFMPPALAGRGVVLVGGSDGGPGGPVHAALLAGHGVPALSLAYWRHPGTPDDLREIDVEVVGRACDWLRAQTDVADVPPSVIGISRGGELALLAASLMPDRVGPVCSIVGSGVPWGAWGRDVDPRDLAWRFEGEPVPQMDEGEDGSDDSLDDAAMVAVAEIPVERATGPVLLLSGEDDQMWPSARLSRIAEARAERLGAGDRVTHVAYPDGGHQVGLPPGYPLPSQLRHPVNDVVYPFGGTRVGNQAARRDAWRRILELVEAPLR